ncbi:MAG: J domain-containing protein [Hylemonella sp.]|uniref:J domain-containing protein n=1 Tax=Hylemonella sp. TaxID=2066020 RepID=UPI003919A842
MSTQISRYPLQWPAGWKRTAALERSIGRFGKAERSGGYPYKRDVTLFQAAARLLQELQRMGIHGDDVVLSTNVPTRLDGMPRSDAKAPADPGAAVYWLDDKGQHRCMAIDQYTKVEMNVAALAATIEAMRAIERHGGAAILDRAFTGFAALPAPIRPGMKRDWWDVLQIPRDSNADQVRQAYRALASKFHPDKPGGSNEKMAELNTAREAGLAATGGAA